MAELKAQLRADLTAAMKARETLTVGTLRMALSAITTEEVAGTEARQLSDDEVRQVLAREVRKRKESAEAFAAAGRSEAADTERAEGAVLAGYLPTQLDDGELGELVGEAVAEVAAELGTDPGQKQMGQVMKAARTKVGDRAEGGRIAAAVKARLAG